MSAATAESGSFTHRSTSYGWVVDGKGSAEWTYAIHLASDGAHFAKLPGPPGLDDRGMLAAASLWLAGRERGIAEGVAEQARRMRDLIGAAAA